MPTVTQVPYEFLVRWREGVFSGAHVGWSLLVTEDDGTKRELPQPVEPVDVGQGKGFPLADILDKLSADALIAVAAKDVEIAETISAKDVAITTAASEKAAELAAKDTEIAAKDTEIAAKAAEIAAENAIAVAAKALAAKIAEVADAEKDDPDRAAKEAEAALLAEQVAVKDAELALLKLPEKERKAAQLRAEAAEKLKQADDLVEAKAA